MIGKTRRDFAKINDMSVNTLAAWELGILPISEKGMNLYVKALGNCGLAVSKEWMLTGKGPHPIKLSEIESGNDNMINDNLSLEQYNIISIIKEAKFFTSNLPNSVVFSVTDYSMMPIYRSGDYVGGVKLNHSKKTNAHNTICIVKLKNGISLLRQVLINNDTINLMTTNFFTDTQITVHNPDIEYLAPVIWHRKLTYL